MSILNNELWVKSIDGTQVEMYTTSGFTETLVSTRLTDDGWTVFTFGSDLTVIGDHAFYMKDITDVIFPATITQIKGSGTFYLTPLSSITCYATTAPELNRYAFQHVDDWGVLYYPEGSDYSSWMGTNSYYLGYGGWYSTPIGTEVFVPERYYPESIANNELWVRNARRTLVPMSDGSGFQQTLVNTELVNGWTVFTFDSDLTVIGKRAFDYSNQNLGIVDVIIPETVTEIAQYAFQNQSALKSINFPETLTFIGHDAFYMGNSVPCTGITSIEFGLNLREIEYRAFWNVKLTSIKCNALIAPVIDDDTFCNVGTNGTLYYPEGSDYSSWLNTSTNYLGYYGWNGETFISDVEIDPNRIIKVRTTDGEIPDYVEDNTSVSLVGINQVEDNWVEFIFANDITFVPSYYFHDAFTITDVVLPETCITIETGAFYHCTRLTGITIPDSVTTIEGMAFQHCYGLTEVTIPDSVTSIGYQAFYYCEALTGVTIGSGVKSIGEWAFNYCSSLTSIKTNAITAPSIASNTFSNVPTGGTLYYPEGSDYSQWLSRNAYYLGYYGWNDVEPDTPTPDPDEPDTPDPDEPVNPDPDNPDTPDPDDPDTPTPDVPDDPDEPGDDNTEATFFIPTNELWVRNWDKTLIEDIDAADFTETLVNTRLSTDGWTVLTFDKPLTKIGDYALQPGQIHGSSGFRWTHSIYEIIIPATVTSIGYQALYYNNLTRIYMNSLTPPVFDEKPWYSDICTIYYPKGGDYSSWKTALNGHGINKFYETNDFTDLNNFNYMKTQWESGYRPMTEHVESDVLEIYYGYDDWWYMTYPLTHTKVSDSLFYRDPLYDPAYSCHMTKFRLSDGFTSIGKCAFSLCRNLEEVVLSDNIVSIGNSAFANVTYTYTGPTTTNATSLIIPDSVTTIGDRAFLNATLFNEIHIGKGIKTIGESAFKDTHADIHIYGNLPSGIKYGEYFTNVEDMYIYDGVKSLGSYIFSGNRTDKITSYASTTPSITPNTFYGVEQGGTLYYPYGSDYSTWLSTSPYYLGYYGWNGIAMKDHPSTNLFLFVSPSAITSTYNGLTTDITVDSNSTDIVISHPDWITVTQKDEMTYEVVISRETESEIREGDITITASMEGQNDITKTISVYQEASDKPYVILSENRMLLDGSGANRNMQVTYVNIEEIIPPELPEGYEIEETITEQISDNTTQVTYKVKRQNAAQKVFTANFYGKGANGKVVSSENLKLDGWAGDKVGATLDGFNFYGMSMGDPYMIEGMEDTFIFDSASETRWIDFNINNYKKPYEVTYTIDDPNNALTFVSSEAEYENEGDKYAVWRLSFKSKDNNGTSAYQGVITINYKDENTEFAKEIPFYVKYPNHPLIKSFYSILKYDAAGVRTSNNYTDITCGYANIQTINKPKCSPWITISEGVLDTGTYNTYDKVYKYATVTVEPNNGPERIGNITFNGTGTDGKYWEYSAEITQEGYDTEPAPIDEGYIELQSLSVVLPSSGGSDTFQVKYYDAYLIEMPELVGNWATITETSSSQADGVAWNGEECVVTTKTYKVTANATTTGREMKVICRSKINYYDGGYVSMEKDKFRIQQLAPGATEYTGRVVPFKSEVTYTNAGLGESILVGYKDIASSLEPSIDVDWISIESVTDKTYSSKEYDRIEEYELNVQSNISEVSRMGTITFRGKNQDGTTTTANVVVRQKGFEPSDDAGKYSNYKGYFTDLDGKLYSVSIIANPRSTAFGNIILAADSPVTVSYTENERLFTPVRTSTCTVRIVSSSYLMDIYTGKAQGTQVILKDEDLDEVKWCGYLQPNLYNQGFSAPVEEIELEASDCLSTMQYMKYEHYFDNGRFTIPFSYIIENMMDRTKLISSYYLTQKMYSNSYQSKAFVFNDLYIAEQNFFSEEDDPWTLKEVLEEICKYCGLVCFQWGEKVYFIDYDMYDSDNEMVGYRYDKSERWGKKNYVTMSTPNRIVESSYRGSDGDMSLDDVFNKVSVNCNYYNYEDIIPDIFDDELLDNRFGEGAMFTIPRYTGRGNSVLGNQTYYKVYDHKNINSIYYIPVDKTYTHETKCIPTDADFEDRFFFRKYVGGNIIDMVHLNYNEANGGIGEPKEFDRYLLISQLNRPWCGAEGTFHWENYNFPIMEFKNLPVVFIDNTGSDSVVRTSITKVPSNSTYSSSNRRQTRPALAPNYLVIQASATFVSNFKTEYFDDNQTKSIGKKSGKDYYEYEGTTFDHIRNEPALCFYLEIPQAGWWDGAKWVGYKTHFEVPLEKFGDDSDWYKDDVFATSKSVSNTIQTNLFLGTTGYKIPLPAEMTTTQDMYFAIAMPKRFVHLSDIRGGDYTGEYGNAYCFIKDLKMSVINRNSALYEDEDAIYENVIDADNVVEGDEIDLKITSDCYNGFSFSTVSTFTSEDKYTTDIMFYNKEYEVLKPEENIISRYVNQYSTPSIKTNLTLDLSFLPTQLIRDTYWNKNFVITSQDIDYKYCRQTITLLEKK